MNAEQLLAHFERVADAADAVQHLRRFILDLAVRGKLVDQDPDEEPAHEALQRIEKAWATKTRPGRRVFVTDHEDIEIPFAVPHGWHWIRFGRIHELVRGVTYTKSDVSERPTPDHLPILRANNIQSTLTFDDLVFVRKERVSKEQFLRRGDYLIALSSGSKNLVGKAAFTDSDHEAGFGGFCGVIRVPSPAIESFVGVFLASRLYRDAISTGSRGIGINNLKKETLGNVPFPFPPLAEQHRIVAKVDELMELCDRLEAAQTEREQRRDRLIAASLHRLNNGADAQGFRDHARFTLDQLPRLTTRPDQIALLRKTILNLAVRGKLVAQDPNDEPADELLKRIKAEKVRLANEGKLRSHTTMARRVTAEGPFEIPASWVWVPLGEVMVSRDGERIPISKEERSSRAKVYDYYGASGVIDKIDGFLFDKPLLLVGEDGANLINRSTPIAFIARGKYWVNNHAHVLDGISEDFLRFIEMQINAIDLKPYVTGTAQPKMNQAKMNSIPIALPPEGEQRRIVAKVDELMAVCDRLEAQLTTARTESGRLLEALLHEALGGAAA